MIRAKLPEEVLIPLEMLNGAKNTRTVRKLCERLDDYITAREKAVAKVSDNTKVTTRKCNKLFQRQRRREILFFNKKTLKNIQEGHITCTGGK